MGQQMTLSAMTTRALMVSAALLAISGCDPNKLPHCEDGGESCACEQGVAGTCNDGLICDEIVSLCREPLTCGQAACSSHQLCEPPSATADGACLPACDPGYRWNAVAERCDAVDETCTPQLESECGQQHRACTVPSLGGDPYCGSCLDGFVDENNVCRPRVPCATILNECQRKNRDCRESWFGPNEDARCGPCPTATTLDTEGVCRCDKELTKWDSGGGLCVPVATCLDLSCETSGDICVAAAGDKDAYCDDGCAVGFLWSEQTESCLPCPPCEEFTGTKTAVGVNGRIVNDTGDTCLCATTPGYFFSGAGQVGVFPCDADGDGWVRESARASMYASDVNPAGIDRLKALHDNARCTVRQVTTFVLANDHGQTKDVAVPDAGVLLFESDRNDDDKLLAADLQITKLDKPYGGGDGTATPGDRLPTAVQLNRLTRYCHLQGSDYNDNGAADISEWQGDAPVKSPKKSMKIFNQYSYFNELHRGQIGSGTGAGFVATATLNQPNDQPTEVKSTFRILERTRQDASTFPFAYEGPDETWRTCTRKVDQRLNEVEVPAGIDFGWEAAAPSWPGWRGMTHSSQFHCVQVASTADPQDASQVGLGGPLASWTFNRCTGSNHVTTKTMVPACSVEPQSEIGVGHVGWAAAKFAPYHDTFMSNGPRTRVPAAGDYTRGCVDECAELQDALAVPGQYGAKVAGLDFTVGSACALNATWSGAGDLECSIKPAFGRLQGCSELCGDGVDQDANASTPDVVATGACASGLPGACSAGNRGCFSGLDRCLPKKAADPTAKDYCDAEDNDCDGITDEDGADGVVGAKVKSGSGFVDSGSACSVPGGKGICQAGAWGCSATGAGPRCVASIAPGTQVELCDGQDNDCDGETDEGAQDAKIGQACTVTDLSQLPSGVVPGSICFSGAWQCSGGSLKCGPKASPVTEVCNGVDDDCDGTTDEGGVCDCDMLTGEIWFHGNRDSTYTKPVAADEETQWSDLRHTVTVTPGAWNASNPTTLPIAVKLVVSEVNQPTTLTYTRTVVHAITAGDSRHSSEWYFNYEWQSTNDRRAVRWIAPPETIRSCSTLWNSLPKGVASVAAKAVAQPLTLTYKMGSVLDKDWVLNRAFDLYGSSHFANTLLNYDAASVPYRTLPNTIPDFTGAAPHSYVVTWGVDRWELMRHMPLNCQARCEYWAAYPNHGWLLESGGDCNGKRVECDHIQTSPKLQLTNQLREMHPKATGGAVSGVDNKIGFTVTWEAVPNTDQIGFRRVRTAPGWGNNGNDHLAVFFQTWLRIPVTLTPVK